MPNTDTPVPEIWGRMAMLLARNLPRGHDGQKLLDLWLANPAAAFVTLNQRVRWVPSGRRHRGDMLPGWDGLVGDRDAYTELAALLDVADAPTERRLSDAEAVAFWRGVDAVRHGRA
ncbi:hypothetical protein DI270_017305 [Microbispora triticiradicis]|uniref:Uncharacterized protein n=1 Tax=Microbispora triticiradicis TaxID=2200763 RepID=A0ABX9LIC4_9ACTN|nr:hypothetical protein [Microbispora triticiradicis]RGA03649.1 hypothetical protein DI270_017305 [Microbispora triticiradicis]GLW22929.1 hypothetical protein Mame01_29720 [Microbispora amethystogenes]